jgi:hypothetical protein
MGATDMQYLIAGDSIEDAYQGLLTALEADYDEPEWPDPFTKPGFVKVWETVVNREDAETLAWKIMNGRLPGNQWSEAERRSAMSRFGPWHAIQVANGAPLGDPVRDCCWLFFGWVNTRGGG